MQNKTLLNAKQNCRKCKTKLVLIQNKTLFDAKQNSLRCKTKLSPMQNKTLSDAKQNSLRCKTKLSPMQNKTDRRLRCIAGSTVRTCGQFQSDTSFIYINLDRNLHKKRQNTNMFCCFCGCRMESSFIFCPKCGKRKKNGNNEASSSNSGTSTNSGEVTRDEGQQTVANVKNSTIPSSIQHFPSYMKTKEDDRRSYFEPNKMGNI